MLLSGGKTWLYFFTLCNQSFLNKNASSADEYYLNIPLQLLFIQKLKILSSKNHFIAHRCPQWQNPELHRRKSTKIKITCLELNILSFALYKTFEGIFEPYPHFYLDLIDFTVSQLFNLPRRAITDQPRSNHVTEGQCRLKLFVDTRGHGLLCLSH